MANYNHTFEWRKGAFKGILNVKNWLESHSQALKYHRISAAQVPEILSVMLEDLDEFMETADSFPINVHKDSGGGCGRSFRKGVE